MVEEAYVSFETAKLLKENGFNESCHAYYEDNGTFRESYSAHAIRNITNPCFFGIAAPTQQMAMRWLREIHNISIFILPTNTKGNLAYLGEVCPWNKNEPFYAPDIKYGYEEAVEEAIKFCLKNLI